MHLIAIGHGDFRTRDGKYEVEAERGQFYVYLASDPDDTDSIARFDSLKECRTWLDAQYAPRRVLSHDDLTELPIGSRVYVSKAPAVVFEKTDAGMWCEQPRAKMTYRPRTLSTRLVTRKTVIAVR